jgi:hypothetical protein
VRRPLLVALLVSLAWGSAASPAAAARPLRTAVFDPLHFLDQRAQQAAFDRSRATGATMVRLFLTWKSVAPTPIPPGLDATDPNNPHYNWEWFDRQVRLASARGLEAYANVMYAPAWAEGAGHDERGIFRPDPGAFAAFGRAAARRYSGAFAPPGQPPLPRIRFWLPWGEPNRDYHLMPQYEDGRIVSALQYRALVNGFARAVKAVDPGNRVIAGSLAPLARQGKPAPLAFMRELFCLSRSLRPTCDLHGDPLVFDIWSHHPYTLGGPTHRAGGDDVSLGDLPRMRRTLRAAIRAGHVRSSGPVALWATELGWDTRPPDPRGVPARLHARWVSEALYRLWQNRFTLVTWWRVLDDPLPQGRYQSGLYTAGGAPKLSLTAFRFPVVAFRRARGVYVWGRTPTSRAGRVVLELRAGSGWRRLGVTRANGHGVFTRMFGTRTRRGFLRARFGGERSVPFSLARVPNRVVDPMGCGGGTAC